MDTISQSKHITLEPYDGKRLASLCGQLDEHLRQIENRFNIRISNRGNLFTLTGERGDISSGLSVINALYDQTATTDTLTPEHIHLTIREQQMAFTDNGAPSSANGGAQSQPSLKQAATQGTATQTVQTPGDNTDGNASTPGKAEKADGQFIIKTGKTPIKPRGATQQAYVDKIRRFDVNFGIGPAGTGKTFLAVACALEALDQGEVRKIILTRPAVEAGEKLGFLPGDMVEKINPYLRPLYDALYEMLGFERINKYIDRQIIEIAPLAYMRGRTLNHAFIILDEAQNTTRPQMKMLLTRLGFGSKAIITGDHTQVDLPGSTQSGLKHAMNILDKVPNIGFTYFQPQDVVRHTIVQAIIEAYDAAALQEHEGGNQGKSRRITRRKTPNDPAPVQS